MKFSRRVSQIKRGVWKLVGCRSAIPHGVCLTFDDGPHPEHTPTVLDRLARYNLKATFFLVGKRILDPAQVQQIVDAGHILGNHTFTHDAPRWSDTALSLADVRRCQELIPNGKLFRPPFGKLTPGMWLAARRCGLRVVNWSLDSGDWSCRSAEDAATCAAEVLQLVRPGDVILFHDDHQWIGPILDAVLPALAKRFTVSTSNP